MKPTRVFDFLYYQLEKYPIANAFSSKINGKWVGYSTQQMVEIVNSLSLGLLQLGINKNDKVAIISPNRPEWNFVDLAIQQLGAVSVPMYPTISIEDYKYIFNDAGVKIVFVFDKELHKKVATAIQSLENAPKVFSFEKIEGVSHWKEVEELGKKGDVKILEPLKNAVQPSDLLTLIYTSGTTGKPKGVMLSHNNVCTNAMSVVKALPLDAGKSPILSFLPLCHIYERTASYFYMFMGCSVYYAESMETIAANIVEVKPHCFTTVPRLLEKVYDKIVSKGKALTGIKKALFFWALELGLKYEPHLEMGWWYDFQLKIANKLIFSKWREALGGQLRSISSGSSALQPRLARVFWAAGIKVCEGYGLTETSPVITANLPQKEFTRVGTVGLVIEGVEVKIAEDGEILCKGPNVMMGYYNQPEMTADVLKDGWFHTGDIGTLVEGKYLKITDRKKEMFKTSGGKYVMPQLMENKFKESLFIEQLAIIGENQRFPAALVVPAFDHVKIWCEQHDIPYTTDAEMVKNPKVLEKFQSEVNKYNEGFGDWEKIKKFTLMSKVWGIDSGELTPTLKLKRKIINSIYEKEINAIFAYDN